VPESIYPYINRYGADRRFGCKVDSCIKDNFLAEISSKYSLMNDPRFLKTTRYNMLLALLTPVCKMPLEKITNATGSSNESLEIQQA
jgi:hypothetical protein